MKNNAVEIRAKWKREVLAEIKDKYWRDKIIQHDLNLRKGMYTVFIYRTREAGSWVWAISLDSYFWMDAKKTKREAIALCNAMGWKISKIKS